MMNIKSTLSIAVVSVSVAMALPTFAAGNNGHHHDHSEHAQDEKRMMDHKKMDSNMREVVGNGRVNKVMAKHGMVNIKHEPMPEMGWPQMSMNFKTQDQVDLSNLKPGQQVDFTLIVDDENNYVIKNITVK